LDNQNDTFIEHFSNYHIDKNLIVLGYSGRDKSLMDAIFMAFSKKGSGRLYWCRSEEHTSELQSRENLVCRLLLEKKKTPYTQESPPPHLANQKSPPVPVTKVSGSLAASPSIVYQPPPPLS